MRFYNTPLVRALRGALAGRHPAEADAFAGAAVRAGQVELGVSRQGGIVAQWQQCSVRAGLSLRWHNRHPLVPAQASRVGSGPDVQAGPAVDGESDAVVEHSIIFSDAIVRAGASVRYSIIDKRAKIGQGAIVGYGNPTCPNSRLPEVMSSGVTVIGTQTNVPDGIRIGRNCLVGNDLAPEAIPNRDIVCGETILSDVKWQKISS